MAVMDMAIFVGFGACLRILPLGGHENASGRSANARADWRIEQVARRTLPRGSLPSILAFSTECTGGLGIGRVGNGAIEDDNHGQDSLCISCSLVDLGVTPFGARRVVAPERTFARLCGMLQLLMGFRSSTSNSMSLLGADIAKRDRCAPFVRFSLRRTMLKREPAYELMQTTPEVLQQPQEYTSDVI